MQLVRESVHVCADKGVCKVSKKQHHRLWNESSSKPFLAETQAADEVHLSQTNRRSKQWKVTSEMASSKLSCDLSASCKVSYCHWFSWFHRDSLTFLHSHQKTDHDLFETRTHNKAYLTSELVWGCPSWLWTQIQINMTTVAEGEDWGKIPGLCKCQLQRDDESNISSSYPSTLSVIIHWIVHVLFTGLKEKWMVVIISCCCRHFCPQNWFTHGETLTPELCFSTTFNYPWSLKRYEAIRAIYICIDR